MICAERCQSTNIYAVVYGRKYKFGYSFTINYIFRSQIKTADADALTIIFFAHFH